MIAFILVALAAASCGQPRNAVKTEQLAVAKTAAPQLPAPSTLLTPRSSSAVVLESNGTDYDPGLPNPAVTVNGTAAEFDAVDILGAPEDFSFAFYRFNINGQAVTDLRVSWSSNLFGNGTPFARLRYDLDHRELAAAGGSRAQCEVHQQCGEAHGRRNQRETGHAPGAMQRLRRPEARHHRQRNGEHEHASLE
ncbi:MAG: hypothetical protein M3R04_05410, partial [bacterium]|nr:hypothetical protein [bacterium]